MKSIKSIFYSIAIFAVLISVINLPVVFAQEESEPTSTPGGNSVNEDLSDRINDLKEKIASRVSELNLVEKRGVIGTITETSSNSITLTDIQNQTRLVDIDEITKFASPSAGSNFGLSDLEEGAQIRVLGLYNKDSKRILARFINTSSDPTVLIGTIKEIDEENFQIVLISSDQTETKVDIETSTSTSLFAKNSSELEDSGFSELEIGNRIFVNGFADTNDENLVVADRIIIFGGVPANPQVEIAVPTQSVDASITPAEEEE